MIQINIIESFICIDEDNTSLNEAIMQLFVYYFIFDLQYPTCFRQILGLFHETLFNLETPIVIKNDEYKNIISKLVSN